jgi:hypothetical protein
MSFQGYISYPITVEATTILSEAYDYIKTKSPEWIEHDGNLDTWILQVTASQASDLMALAADVPDTIFKWFGAYLVGIPPQDATASTVDSTWVCNDTLGHLIPAGTMVAIRDDQGIDHGFITSYDVIIPSGVSGTAPGAVSLISVETGSITSGLGGNGVVVPLIDTLTFVLSVTLTGQTAGGMDAELSSDYNTRLARRLQRLSQRPILASDFSLAALDVTGVARAVALDGFNPSNNSFNNERYVAVAALDSNGAPISSTIKTNLGSYLDSQREINFQVPIFDPVVTQIDVTYNVKCISGYTTATVKANADAALAQYFNPTLWGVDPGITDTSAQVQTWVETTTVYWTKVLRVIGNAQGVDRVITMTMGIHGGSLGTTDITLPGHATIATMGTLNGTATP